MLTTIPKHVCLRSYLAEALSTASYLPLVLDWESPASPIRKSMLVEEDWLAAGYDPHDTRSFLGTYMAVSSASIPLGGQM